MSKVPRYFGAMDGQSPIGDWVHYQDYLRLEKRLAEAQAKLPRWIPVSERLPEFEFRCGGDEFVYVLAYGVLEPAEYVYSKTRGWMKTDWDREDKYDFRITHWMPLPERPEGES